MSAPLSRRLAARLPEGVRRRARRLYDRLSGRPPAGFEISREVRAGRIERLEHVPPWGPVLEAMARSAEENPKPAGYGAEYDLIKPHFDMPYYVGRYPDLARKNIDPVAHYLRAGAAEFRDPSPYFSTRHYRRRYREEIAASGLTPFGHWVKEGRAKGYIAAPFRDFEIVAEEVMGRPATEVQTLWADRYADLRDRLEHGTLAEMVNKAAELDPLVAATWPKALQIRIPPFNTNLSVSRIAAMHRLQAQAGFRRARAVVVVNRPRWGGGRRMEGHIAHALAALYGPGEVVVITTEEGGAMPPGKLPEGARHVDFAGTVEEPLDKGEARTRLYVEFVRSLRPEVVFGVNSNLFWSALATYGKAMAATSRIVGCMFCAEHDHFGYWTGWPIKHFYRHFDVLTALATDSRALSEELVERWVLPPEWQDRMAVLPAPADPGIPLAAAPAPLAGRRPQIFWSGRFDRQKRIDLVHAIARAMPHVDIRMWGEPVMGPGAHVSDRPENVHHEGVYRKFTDLPLQEADLWLYTSEWDGVPSILLELAMTGVPVVGTRVGGTGEVLDPAHSWPIPAEAGADAYVAAIEAILADPEAARERAAGLRDATLARRSTAGYEAAIAALLPAPDQPEQEG